MLEYEEYWTRQKGAVMASRIVSIFKKRDGLCNIILDNGSAIETFESYETLLNRLNKLLATPEEE